MIDSKEQKTETTHTAIPKPQIHLSQNSAQIPDLSAIESKALFIEVSGMNIKFSVVVLTHTSRFLEDPSQYVFIRERSRMFFEQPKLVVDPNASL